ncbi:MAG TPA: hypothetical protein VK783_16440 [Bacteroidia bacterium]|nr:hypothetical protein [Bacteroidia bacterium]
MTIPFRTLPTLTSSYYIDGDPHNAIIPQNGSFQAMNSDVCADIATIYQKIPSKAHFLGVGKPSPNN